MSAFLDLQRICRICLHISEQTYDIFTSYYIKENTLLSVMLSKCTSIKPHEEDGLPSLICKECTRQLKRTYSFHIQCEKSDKKLRHIIANVSDKEDEVNMELGNSVVKEEVIDFDNNLMVPTLSNIESYKQENKEDNGTNEVKIEPITDNTQDDCWDAEDDNVILKEFKFKKNLEYMLESEIIKQKSSKKKRERKKQNRVDVEGATVLPESKLPHQCDVCGKLLSTRSNLKAHKVCHTNLRPYKCSQCPAAFRGSSALYQHKKVHSGETPYHCEYCSKQFRRRTSLVNHIRTHTGEKMYNCEICLKNFVQSGQLSIHMLRHKGDKPFLCQDCGKGFALKADLRVHQRIHNGEKPYSCHLCPKTFSTSGNLSIHVRIHNKDVRYHCPECRRGFVTTSAYRVHLKRHKGQRDHQCECGKTFYTTSALKQHRVVHTGEKRYQCKICDKKFTQTSHLSRHFKREHAKPDAPMPPSEHFRVVLTGERPRLDLVYGLPTEGEDVPSPSPTAVDSTPVKRELFPML